jgi:hypothetical protein
MLNSYQLIVYYKKKYIRQIEIALYMNEYLIDLNYSVSTFQVPPSQPAPAPSPDVSVSQLTFFLYYFVKNSLIDTIFYLIPLQKTEPAIIIKFSLIHKYCFQNKTDNQIRR